MQESGTVTSAASRRKGGMTVKVWKILQSLESLEESMARFYERLRQHYSCDAEVAGFFALMRDEEFFHRDIVRYQQRIMFTSAESSSDLQDYDQEAIDQVTRTVEDLVAREPSLTLNEALRAAVTLEASATEQHYRTVVGQASPALGKLVRSLGCCDKDHAARLSSFVLDHGESPSC